MMRREFKCLLDQYGFAPACRSAKPYFPFFCRYPVQSGCLRRILDMYAVPFPFFLPVSRSVSLFAPYSEEVRSAFSVLLSLSRPVRLFAAAS